MEDREIVELYWERSETAISETKKKYERYCYSIAYHILYNREDSEECVNDTYIRAWNAIPPHRPGRLSVFLGKITRNLAIDCYEKIRTIKRGKGQAELILDELQECIPFSDNTEKITEDIVLKDALDAFLSILPQETRKLFVRRYWYASSIKEIAKDFRISESKVKMQLLRTRNQLRVFLEKEGIEI